MNLFFIGKIDEVKVISRVNKTDGRVNTYANVLATNEGIDKDGYLIKATENFSLDVADFGKLQLAKGKFIAYPHKLMNTKNGTYCFPSDELGYLIFDKNPLESLHK